MLIGGCRSPDGLIVRGPPKLMKMLRAEVDELASIGHTCVLAMRISASRHQLLLGIDGGLIPNLRKHAKATVYFPTSGGYSYLRRPENMHHYGDNVDFGEIVKVVGRSEECEKARVYLKVRLLF